MDDKVPKTDITWNLWVESTGVDPTYVYEFGCIMVFGKNQLFLHKKIKNMLTLMPMRR